MLKGKVAWLTGAGSGIGRAGAEALAAAGATVVLSGRRADQLEEAAAAIKAAGGKVETAPVDVSDKAAVAEAAAAILKRHGKVDILVNSAGVLAIAPITEFTTEDIDRTIAVNIRAAVIASRAGARVMGKGGRIIHIGSTNAERMPFAGGAVYAMSKSALQGLTQGLARDLGPTGITVNVVQPGPVDTDMNPANGPMAAGMIPYLAIGRYGHPDEVASFVAYLAGPEAGNITGASLMIDGGFAA